MVRQEGREGVEGERVRIKHLSNVSYVWNIIMAVLI